MIEFSPKPATMHTLSSQISSAQRCRALERDSYPLDPGMEDLAELVGSSRGPQIYVATINRGGLTADSSFRDPRKPFAETGTDIGEIPLSTNPGHASARLIGAVTGPYLPPENSWHGMLLVTREEKPIPTPASLHAEELTNIHRMVAQHLLGPNKPNRFRFVGFSISPFENKRTINLATPDGIRPVLFPRSPVQNLATLHLHLGEGDYKTLQQAPTDPNKRFDRRMLNEPKLDALLEILRETVILEVAREFPDLPISYSEHTQDDMAFPKGAFITLPKHYLTSSRFAEFVKRFDQQFQDVYWKIADVFADKNLLMDGVVKVRPPEEIEIKLSELLSSDQFSMLPKQAQKLLRLVARLKDPKQMINENMEPMEIAKIIENFILLGPAYNAVYYMNSQTTFTFAITPRWLSGASPIETIGILKDHTVVTEEEFLPAMRAHLDIARGKLRRFKRAISN